MPASSFRGSPRAFLLAPIASSTPIRGASRRAIRATPSGSRSSPRGVIVDPKEDCCICVADLVEKRTVVLIPCRHSFHATCSNIWLETRSGRSAQTCPLCRARVHAVEANGTSAPPLFPYGETGEPTRRVLQHEPQPENLQWLLLQCDERLLTCAQLEAAARLASRPNEYLMDIQNEARGMLARKEVLNGLLEEVERGEWEQRPQRLQLSAEHLERASRRLLQLQQMLHQERFQFVAGNFARPTAASVAATRPIPPAAPRPTAASVAATRPMAPPAPRPTAASVAATRPMPPPAPRRLAMAVPQRAAGQLQHPQLLPRGTAAATQNRLPTIPIPFNAGRATVASRARAARAAAPPPPPTAAAPSQRRPAAHFRPLAATGRVSAATAGPARRRLVATSGASPSAASPPTRQRRVTRDVANEMGGLVVHGETLQMPVNEEDEEVVNYQETPRRSDRIARRRLESMNI